MRANGRRGFVRFTHVAVMLCTIGLLAGCGKDYSREQFKSLTINKTEAEVREAVGDPSWVSNTQPARWIYYRKTFDATQHHDDYSVTLNFTKDPATGQSKVASVQFAATSN